MQRAGAAALFFFFLSVHAHKTGKTDWDAFWKDDYPTNIDEDLEQWTREIIHSVNKHTKEAQLTSKIRDVDPHLLHLWETQRSLTRRWKQKKKRKRKKRIAMLSKQAEKYADKLRWQNWNQVCNSLQGTLSTRKMWNILRSLISRKESKTVTGQHIEHLIHNFPGTEDVVKAVK